MAITGKKINELESIVNPTLETVLPAVKVEGNTTSDTATKITLQDIKTISQEGVLAQPNIQNLSGTNITINTLTANTIYQCGTISSLTISNFENSYEESLIYFTTNSSDFTLTFTITPTWLEGSQPTLELGKNYILHLRNGIASIQGGSNNIIIDDTLSNNSENPVQNKVITNALSGKANLSSGNIFSGKQQIYQGEGVDYAITFNKAGVTGTAGFSIGANGVTLSAPSSNLDINNRTVFKNITTLGNIAGTTQSLSAFTVEGCYTANLNGTATIKLPTPTSTQAMKENTINILLNITGDSNITWQDTNSNGINANTCMTTFAVGNYLIKLRYNNATSNWIGEVLKGESVASTTKAYFSFNDGYADETGNTTLTPYSGYTPVFSSEYTAFSGRKSLEVGNNVNTKYFIPSGFNNIVLSGPFNIRFWVQKDTIGRNALTILNYVSPGGTSYKLLEIFDTYFKFKAATDAQATSIQDVLYVQNQSFALGNTMHYIEVSRDSNNTVRLFIDGVVKATSAYSNDIYLPANEALFSSQMWYIQDFVIEAQVGHISAYDVPTTPYSISEQSLSDYHDDTKQNVLTTIKGFNASATQTLKNINGVIQWVTD